jgi:glycosyltransferase involved in cell wall biosynthesis
VRLLVFHGYLLRGTGSNVYNARLAVALARAGHEVHVLSQEGRPQDVEGLDHPAIHLHRPDIGGLLPVYVPDEYEGFEVRRFADLTDAQLDAYLEANVRAVAEVAGRVRPDAALANHLVMGPVVLARGLPAEVPYAVKVHGSALEYTVRPQPERFLPFAREGLARARTVLVGSRHTAAALEEVVGDGVRSRTFLGPPGVDDATFRPREPDVARAEIRALAARLRGRGTEGVGSFARDLDEVAARLDALPLEADLVLYVGKFLAAKGVDLLVAALPLVPGPHLALVGFGAARGALERLVAALDAGDRAAALAVARELAAEPGGGHVLRFVEGAGDAYFAAARGLAARVTVVGRLEHEELAPLVALASAQVVPSAFPEAFGMVAAEAAASGTVPVVADHSGLGEVADVLGPAAGRFDNGDVAGLAAALRAALATDAAPLVDVAVARFGWDGVARSVVAAALGRHEELVAL